MREEKQSRIDTGFQAMALAPAFAFSLNNNPVRISLCV
jgi:hypothetical protein